MALVSTGALVMTILSFVLCDFMHVDLPVVELSTGQIVDAYVGPAGLIDSCRPPIDYRGGVKYSSAFAMAVCAAIVGSGATILACAAIAIEFSTGYLCGISYAYSVCALLEGMTLTLFRSWECDEGTCKIGTGAGLALGATAAWLVCSVMSCTLPVKIPKA
eukprot:CAMPEP_0197725162 /NCGR_PEP_ID=MMETSP1434-20131217/6803_1 /TAXON_ID=265543 /ORGANISM="Minutocellus polymorphus, Strain CCMP3303" /LENGTH=160 /DNA_ID=CAMNT_0043310611 /DNA_START=181 /DNA_END=663 /DNA_ORIENTATION=+